MLPLLHHTTHPPPNPLGSRCAQEYGCNVLSLGQERIISVHAETARQIVRSPFFNGDVQVCAGVAWCSFAWRCASTFLHGKA